ncbi:MAG: Hsp20/alpha crystallin family protein [Proteobacteria bacterium]|nr:Hsp20/alpha crystallin family protein [Pseudomonadota bacterium]
MGKHVEVRQNNAVPVEVNDTWAAFRHEAERLFDRFSSGFENFTFRPLSNVEYLFSRQLDGFAPLAVDASEDDKAYMISVELPGVEEKNVDVSVTDSTLLIKGEKQQTSEDKSKNRYIAERSYGMFQRSFALPEYADASKVTAKYVKGVLMITIPKSADAINPRKIDVKAA